MAMTKTESQTHGIEFVPYVEGGKKLVPSSYYGGKATHLDFILPLMKTKKKQMEPFCGSSVVTLNHYRSPIEIINDISSRVHNFFNVLRTKILNDQFLDQLSLTIISEEDFREAKIVSTDLVEEARRFMILSNQSFMSNGSSFQFTPNVVRNSMSQNVSKWLGRYPMVERTVQRLKMAQVLNTDGVHLIKKSACEDTMVFADPPYPKEVRTAQDVYQHEMTDEQHVVFLETVIKSPADIMISSYENSLYDEYLLSRDDWYKVLDKKKKLAGHGSVRQEVLYMNYHPNDVDQRIHESILKRIKLDQKAKS